SCKERYTKNTNQNRKIESKRKRIVIMVLMNKKAMMKLALVLFLLGFTATVVDARFDSNSFITQLLSNGGASNKACCDSCLCTRSIPPRCRCNDIGETCHSACKTCICTRSLPPQCPCLCTRSLPPKCSCTDITDFCYKKCN
ncbi:hypothetical protein KIW84_033628, partial [Lathyrus oleraceus]